MSVVATDRETLVREIAELDALLQEKRAMLPVTYKQIYVFVTRPEKRCISTPVASTKPGRNCTLE
jgi:hypothetical protein